MHLSLSGRLIETAQGPRLPMTAFLELAARCGYDGVDLRWSQLNVDSPGADVDAVRAGLARHGLKLCETQFGRPLDDRGEAAFARFAACVAGLGASGIRLGGDLSALKRAARLAAPHGLRVLYQMHTGGPFETVASAAQALAEVHEPNFAVMPEPANLLMAREGFTETMLAPLRGHIGGVHVQTLVVTPTASQSLKLRDGTVVRYERVPYRANDQIPWALFFAALRHAGFDGFVNELEPAPSPDETESTARDAAAFLRPFVAPA